MIKVAKAIRDVFIIILALFTAFGMGYIACSEMFKKVLEGMVEETERPKRVSYTSYFKKDQG